MWLESAQECADSTDNASAAILVLSMGDAAPGAFRGEPTYDLATSKPSYQTRMQAVAGKDATSKRFEASCECGEAALLRTAASAETLGFSPISWC